MHRRAAQSPRVSVLWFRAAGSRRRTCWPACSSWRTRRHRVGPSSFACRGRCGPQRRRIEDWKTTWWVLKELGSETETVRPWWWRVRWQSLPNRRWKILSVTAKGSSWWRCWRPYLPSDAARKRKCPSTPTIVIQHWPNKAGEFGVHNDPPV